MVELMDRSLPAGSLLPGGCGTRATFTPIFFRDPYERVKIKDARMQKTIWKIMLRLYLAQTCMLVNYIFVSHEWI